MMEDAPSLAPSNWDLEADVVVAGFGAAGFAASVSAHDSGAQVVIHSVHIRLVEGREEVDHRGRTSTGREFDKAVSEGLPSKVCVKGSVSGDEIDVAGAVASWSGPALPDTRPRAVGRQVQHALPFKSVCVVSE